MSATQHMTDEELLQHIDDLPDEEEEQNSSEDEGEENKSDENSDDGTEGDEGSEDTDADDESQNGDTDDDNDGASDDNDSDDANDNDDDAGSADDDDANESQDDDDDSKGDNDDQDDTDGDTQKPDEIDYKAFYEDVTGEYKANGKMMPGLKKPEDFRTALSMASNYAQKTTAMKGHMGRIKMLKDISDDDLNVMMDLHNGDKAAIQKALLDAGIDPVDIDPDKPVEYKVNDHSVSDEQVEFDTVIDGIRDTETFDRTSEVVTKTWDARSRKEMLDNPALIVALNEEMAMDRFDTIQSKIDQVKMLGQTQGKSDLELYQVFATRANEERDPAPVSKKVETPKKKVDDPAKKAAKQKANINAKKTKKSTKKYDPAQLSDDEFLALLDSGATFL